MAAAVIYRTSFYFHPQKDHIDRFWGEVDEIKFPTVSLFVKSLLALPHSNADVERVFSEVALIKTKHKNRLKTSTLDALLVDCQVNVYILFRIQTCASVLVQECILAPQVVRMILTDRHSVTDVCYMYYM